MEDPARQKFIKLFNWATLSCSFWRPTDTLKIYIDLWKIYGEEKKSIIYETIIYDTIPVRRWLFKKDFFFIV